MCLHGPSSTACTWDTVYPVRRSFDLSNSPPLVGSGQFGKPFERRQRAKASAAVCAPEAAFVGGGTPDAPGEPPPPQPAASVANAATAMTELRKNGRGRRMM